MDIATIKSKNAADGVTKAVNNDEVANSGNNLTNAFGSLLQNAGMRMENSLNSLTDQANMGRVDKPERTPERRDEHSRNRENRDEDVAKTRRRDSSDDRSERRADNHNDDHRVERDNDRSDNQSIDRAEKPNDQHNTSKQDDDNRNESSNSGKNAKQDDGSDNNGAEAQNQNGSDSQVKDQDTEASNNLATENNVGGEAVNAAGFGKQDPVAPDILASLVNGAQTANKKGKGTEITGKKAGIAGTGKDNAENVLNKTNQRQQAQLSGQTSEQAKAKNAAKTDPTSTKIQQAAGIAKAIGPNDKLAVKVNVTDENAKLVSKPSASLTNTTVSNEHGAQSLRAQQGQQGPLHAGMTQSQTQAGQQTQGGQGQSGNDIAAAKAQTGTQAKGLAQTTQTANTSHQTGGSEGTAPAGAQNAQQTPQQAAANKAQAAKTFNLPQKAVVDQVTVQISKAVSAGMDKINIQLKPGGLGRVDVQLEMTQDGRVSALVTADNKDTLDLLKQDSRELEKALQDAGLSADEDSLEFNLREQSGEGQNDGQNGGSGRGDSEDQNDDLAAAPHVTRDIITKDRIDVRA